MLDTVFLSILDMTKVGSLVILAVLLARLLLRRTPKVLSYGLWAVVLLRLLCPVGLQSPVSVLPQITPTAQEYSLEDQPISFAGAGIAAYRAVGDVLNGGIDDQRVATDLTDAQGNVIYVSAGIWDVWILFGSYLWAAGFGVLGVSSLVSILRLKRKLQEAVRLEKGLYLADAIDSPFVMGLFSPRIYLPQGLENREMGYILAHERHHIRRLDPLWKALGFLALSIHWFNPLVWAAFILACRDMEMSCDEAVLKAFGPEIRSEYAASLLKIATGKRILAGSPLAFGEGDPKSRIRNLAKWKKPIIWITVLALVLCAVLGVCLLTDPMSSDTTVGRSLFFGTVKYTEQDELVLSCEDGREIEFRLAQDYALPEGIGAGTQVIIQATWSEELRIYRTGKVSVTESSISASLDEAIEAAILNNEGKREGEFACASFVTLSKGSDGIISEASGEKKIDTVTVYGLALHQRYVRQGDTVREAGGSHIPVAITFRVSDGGEYVLAEYWFPRDGSFYARDIRKKFPLGQVPDTQRYIADQQAACDAKAEAHFGVPVSREEPSGSPETRPLTLDSSWGFDIDKVPQDGSLPLEQLPEGYSREDAIRDGVVILESGYATHNAQQWDRFYQKVERKEPARIRTAICNDGKVSQLRDILFDGSRFRTRTTLQSDGNTVKIWDHDYAFLQVFRGTNRNDTGAVIEEFASYVLTQTQLDSPPPWMNTVFRNEDGALLVYQSVVAVDPKPPAA